MIKLLSLCDKLVFEKFLKELSFKISYLYCVL